MAAISQVRQIVAFAWWLPQSNPSCCKRISSICHVVSVSCHDRERSSLQRARQFVALLFTYADQIMFSGCQPFLRRINGRSKVAIFIIYG